LGIHQRSNNEKLSSAKRFDLIESDEPFSVLENGVDFSFHGALPQIFV
jgi:hypothetical protein